MRALHITSLVLAVIGAVNWGAIGIFQYNLVAAALNPVHPLVSRGVYILVGLAGVVLTYSATVFTRKIPMYHARETHHHHAVAHPVRRAA